MLITPSFAIHALLDYISSWPGDTVYEHTFNHWIFCDNVFHNTERHFCICVLASAGKL